MPPKTERFELRLDEGLIAKIDQWRGEQDELPTRSEAVRQLIEAALSGRNSKTLTIEPTDRLILGILSEIHKNVVKGKHPEYDADFIMSSIYGGHFWALDWELTGLLHNQVDRAEHVREVVDTLDMWSFLEPAYASLSQSDKDLVDASNPYLQTSFVGYDGNYETEHMAIVSHLVDKMERFQFLKGRSTNSHSPQRDTYRRMVGVFEPIRKDLGFGRKIGVGDLIKVLNA